MREDVGDQTSVHDHGDLNIVQSGEYMNAYHKRCLSSIKSKTLINCEGDPCWLQEASQGRSGARTFVQVEWRL